MENLIKGKKNEEVWKVFESVFKKYNHPMKEEWKNESENNQILKSYSLMMVMMSCWIINNCNNLNFKVADSSAWFSLIFIIINSLSTDWMYDIHRYLIFNSKKFSYQANFQQKICDRDRQYKHGQ